MAETACCRSEDLPGKGKAVVAQRDINIGELIIHEQPLIRIPWWIRHSVYPRNGREKYLKKALTEMHPDNLNKFFELHDSKCLPGEEKTEDGIWRTNNFALGCYGARSDNGLFLKMSRFNHSCVPSGEFHWNDQYSRQEIRAIKNIQAGEEITICYFTIEIAVHTQQERKQFLLDHYGFPCDCPDCSLTGDEAKKNDEDRHLVYKLDLQIDNLLYYNASEIAERGCDTSSEENVSSTDSREVADVHEGLELSMKRLHLMNKLGFKIVSRLRLCKIVLEYALEWEHFDSEKAIVNAGLEFARILHGENSKEYRYWRKHFDICGSTIGGSSFTSQIHDRSYVNNCFLDI